MNECRCLIRHARTPAEQAEVAKGLVYARSVGDAMGTMLALAQLGPCKSDPVEPPQAHAERVKRLEAEAAAKAPASKRSKRAKRGTSGRCATCSVPEHDVCGNDPNCSCCSYTAAHKDD